MKPAMDEVGRWLEKNEYFVPELLLAPRAMKACIELNRPLLASGGSEPTGRVAMSALLTTTMPAMKMTIEAVGQSGMPHNIKIMIGGAPITEQCAKEIGADGYSARPAGAVGVARQLMG